MEERQRPSSRTTKNATARGDCWPCLSDDAAIHGSGAMISTKTRRTDTKGARQRNNPASSSHSVKVTDGPASCSSSRERRAASPVHRARRRKPYGAAGARPGPGNLARQTAPLPLTHWPRRVRVWLFSPPDLCLSAPVPTVPPPSATCTWHCCCMIKSEPARRPFGPRGAAVRHA